MGVHVALAGLSIEDRELVLDLLAQIRQLVFELVELLLGLVTCLLSAVDGLRRDRDDKAVPVVVQCRRTAGHAHMKAPPSAMNVWPVR